MVDRSDHPTGVLILGFRESFDLDAVVVGTVFLRLLEIYLPWRAVLDCRG